NDHYEFSIHDNGIGIEEEFYDIIFVLFQRGIDVDSYDGLGKGFALAKNIVELHNGTIWVDQSNATGSSITFTLNKR
ncbi:MAG: ATP-binding protein, partial [Rickettsiales bacterium]|nr:ATP-binding protein [Rickettsiales bacterium]